MAKTLNDLPEELLIMIVREVRKLRKEPGKSTMESTMDSTQRSFTDLLNMSLTSRRHHAIGMPMLNSVLIAIIRLFLPPWHPNMPKLDTRGKSIQLREYVENIRLAGPFTNAQDSLAASLAYDAYTGLWTNQFDIRPDWVPGLRDDLQTYMWHEQTALLCKLKSYYPDLIALKFVEESNVFEVSTVEKENDAVAGEENGAVQVENATG
ncbi:uncharacterized protein KY384_000770 [Bacidia gigantensis]|uniref:uncharacterized protein n=1 Tax=Bacidia gigantensis TaxID=2732470 RepID=UPI001D049E79|nr:uncharacterized protein KY384_000770 [Bacidia gigantensis]KAG8526008.1 hypothetical protein KY384_000770 [Bacidia gigantensis]